MAQILSGIFGNMAFLILLLMILTEYLRNWWRKLECAFWTTPTL